MTTRNEHDLLGDAAVPEDAYWGIHTLRAIENYPISGKPIGSYGDRISALALVSYAAALNRELASSTRGAPTPSSAPARKSPKGACTSSSSSTSSRAGPVPRPT